MSNHRKIEPVVGSKAIVTSLTWSVSRYRREVISYPIALGSRLQFRASKLIQQLVAMILMIWSELDLCSYGPMSNHRKIEPVVGSKAIVTSLTWSVSRYRREAISYPIALGSSSCMRSAFRKLFFEHIAISSFKTHSTIGRDDSNDLERIGLVIVRSNAESSQNGACGQFESDRDFLNMEFPAIDGRRSHILSPWGAGFCHYLLGFAMRITFINFSCFLKLLY
ncbi:hypothetical protein U1Q18_017417 [Sarracenia purpurea var. burkii]